MRCTSSGSGCYDVPTCRKWRNSIGNLSEVARTTLSTMRRESLLAWIELQP